MGAVGKPHHEVEGWLRSGLQCTGRRRRRRPDHCRARTDAVRQRSGSAGAPDRGHREQSRPKAEAGLSGLRLLQRIQSRSARSTRHRRLCRARARQAPDSSERKNRRTADPTDAKEDRRRRLRNTLPIEKASGGTSVRTDQTGTRLPPVPVARPRESARRMGHDLHRPQPPQAVQPRKHSVCRLTCNKCPSQPLSGRAPRGAKLTDAGARLYEHVGPGIESLLEAEQAAVSDQAELKGRLRLSLPQTFEPWWDMLAAFQRRYPDIQIHVYSTERRVDLVEDGIDVALRVGAIVHEAMVARRVLSYRNVLVASPRLVERFGVPVHPDALHRLPCAVWASRIDVPARWELGGHIV